jgi:hypothetical protein
MGKPKRISNKSSKRRNMPEKVIQKKKGIENLDRGNRTSYQEKVGILQKISI